MELNALKTTVILNPRQLYLKEQINVKKKKNWASWCGMLEGTLDGDMICKLFTGKDTVSVFNSVLIG